MSCLFGVSWKPYIALWWTQPTSWVSPEEEETTTKEIKLKKTTTKNTELHLTVYESITDQEFVFFSCEVNFEGLT